MTDMQIPFVQFDALKQSLLLVQKSPGNLDWGGILVDFEFVQVAIPEGS